MIKIVYKGIHLMTVPFAERYRILEELERTQQVVSYLCRDESYGLEVEVDAIETGECASSDLLQRLRQVLDAALKISTRYAAPLLDWCEEKGHIYVIRERMDGQPVAQILAETGELPRRQVVEIARAAIEALSEAYGRGIYYLGLNPGQLWVDARGQVKVARAGYAWIIEELDGKSSARVSPYRAPETDGAVEGARISDVYSLALIIKQMLPREAASDRLQSLLERCLDPIPSHRPSSPRLLLEELEAIEVGQKPKPPNHPDNGSIPGEDGQEIEDYFKAASSYTLHKESSGRHLLRTVALMLLGGIIGWLIFAATSGTLNHGNNSQLTAAESKETQVTLPDLEGLPAQEAQNVVEKLGLTVELREAPSRLWSAGMVAAQEPAQGSILAEGDLVYLSISSGSNNAEASSAASQGQAQSPPPADSGSQTIADSSSSSPGETATLPGGNSQPTSDKTKAAPLAPRAVPSISTRRGAAPLYVVLDGASSYDPDGRIIRYLWDCGDGTILEGVRAQHVFDPPVIPAQFHVSLQVFDNQGLKASTSLTVEVD